MRYAKFIVMTGRGSKMETVQSEKEGKSFEEFCGYIRTSEWVEVEFPPLESDAIVEKQINALDAAESELRNKFQIALNDIEQQRAELRSITVKAL